MPQKFITSAVLRTLERLDFKEGSTLLDLSCGEGEILAALSKRFNVRGSRFSDCDYIIEKDFLSESGITVDANVDLRAPLPYADSSFDIVLLTEVLEHLEMHSSLISEIGRILKPDGCFIFSTPNIFRIHSRWKFFLTGSHKLIRRRVGWDLPREELYAYHIRPVDLQLMHAMLYQAQMKMCAVKVTRFKLKHAYWFLLYPLFYGAALLEYRESGTDARRLEGEKELRKWMTSLPVMFSEQLLVTARKSNALRLEAPDRRHLRLRQAERH